MNSPLWTQSRTTDDQDKVTTTDLTPPQVASVAAAICEYLAYGRYDRPLMQGSTLVTYEANNAATAAVNRLNRAAAAAGTPITTQTVTANTQVGTIARKLGTPQWT